MTEPTDDKPAAGKDAADKPEVTQPEEWDFSRLAAQAARRGGRTPSWDEQDFSRLAAQSAHLDSEAPWDEQDFARISTGPRRAGRTDAQREPLGARFRRAVSRVRLPRVRVPQIRVPEIRLPRITLPRVRLPSFHLPRVRLPQIRVPEIHLPRVRVPRVRLPEIHLPRVTVPRVRFPNVRIPRVRLPEIRLPEIHLPRVRVPRVRLPRIGARIGATFAGKGPQWRAGAFAAAGFCLFFIAARSTVIDWRDADAVAVVEAPPVSAPVSIATAEHLFDAYRVPLPLARVPYRPPASRVAATPEAPAPVDADVLPPRFNLPGTQRGRDYRAATAEVQVRLLRLGYAAGAPTGEPSARTSQALAMFQKSAGLPATGTVDAETIDRLRRASAS